MQRDFARDAQCDQFAAAVYMGLRGIDSEEAYDYCKHFGAARLKHERTVQASAMGDSAPRTQVHNEQVITRLAEQRTTAASASSQGKYRARVLSVKQANDKFDVVELEGWDEPLRAWDHHRDAVRAAHANQTAVQFTVGEHSNRNFWKMLNVREAVDVLA